MHFATPKPAEQSHNQEVCRPAPLGMHLAAVPADADAENGKHHIAGIIALPVVMRAAVQVFIDYFLFVIF